MGLSLAGLGLFLGGLVGLAWYGYDARLQPRYLRRGWLVVILCGLLLLFGGAWWAGAPETGLHYPKFGDEVGD